RAPGVRRAPRLHCPQRGKALETSSSENGTQMPEATVLVVDDEPLVREILSRYLTREGFAVQTAADGQQGLERWLAESPDLVLLDLMLPQVNGLDVFRRGRETSDTPVIILTPTAHEPDRLSGLDI